jgi:hypothetical protein
MISRQTKIMLVALRFSPVPDPAPPNYADSLLGELPGLFPNVSLSVPGD